MNCTKALVLLGLLFAIVALVSSEVVTQTSTDQKSNELDKEDTKTVDDQRLERCSSWGGGGHRGGCLRGRGSGGWGDGGGRWVDAGQEETNAIEDDKHRGGWDGDGRGGDWGGGGRGGWGGGRGGGWGSGSMTSEEDLTVPMQSGQEETNAIEDDKHRGGWGGVGRGGGGWGGGRGGGGWVGGRGGGGWGGGGSMANQEEITVPMISGGPRCSFGCCRQWGGGYGRPRRCTYCRCPTEAEISGVQP